MMLNKDAIFFRQEYLFHLCRLRLCQGGILEIQIHISEKKRSPKMGWDPVQTFTDKGGASNNTRMKYKLRFCCSWNWSVCLFKYKAQKYAIIHSPTFHNCKWTLFVQAHHGFSNFWHTYTQLPKSPWPQEAVAKGSLFLSQTYWFGMQITNLELDKAPFWYMTVNFSKPSATYIIYMIILNPGGSLTTLGDNTEIA